MIESAEDHSDRIGGALEQLHEKRLPIPGGTVRFTLLNSQLQQDGDPDLYRAIVEYRARLIAERL